MSEPWTIARVLNWAADDLAKRTTASPRLDAELMLAQVLACDRIRLILDANRPLSDDELGSYRALHKRRRRGEPIAYLRGHREFYSRTFLVDKRVLVPRPETELLVEVGLKRSEHLSLSARVLDLCSGSGCVAITIKKERPTNDVYGVDLSADALAVARLNGERLGAMVGWFKGDLLSAWNGPKLDLIVTNPPYIPASDYEELPVDVRDFEPRMALVGGDDGLEIVGAIIEASPRHLAANGILAFELMAGQAGSVATKLENAGFVDLEIAPDYAGHDRVVSARWPGEFPGPMAR